MAYKNQVIPPGGHLEFDNAIRWKRVVKVKLFFQDLIFYELFTFQLSNIRKCFRVFQRLKYKSNSIIFLFFK